MNKKFFICWVNIFMMYLSLVFVISYIFVYSSQHSRAPVKETDNNLAVNESIPVYENFILGDESSLNSLNVTADFTGIRDLLSIFGNSGGHGGMNPESIPQERTKADNDDNNKLIIDRLSDINKKIDTLQNVIKVPQVDTINMSPIGNKKLCSEIVGLSRPEYCNSIGEEGATKIFARSCAEIKKNGEDKSGIYTIKPTNQYKPFSVLCDMEIRDGGWTVIQQRIDGSEEFYREWRDYRFGFGHLNQEFWIGLENIYQITANKVELLVEITDRDQKKGYAYYKEFALAPEEEGYAIKVLTDYSGDAGDSLNVHLGAKFSTKDLDQDQSVKFNCAEVYLGAWWFENCLDSNLNGKFVNIPLDKKYRAKCIYWISFRENGYCHAGSRMLVRSKHN